MVPALQNIFSSPSGEPGSESLLTLFQSAGVKIERIVSRSHSGPKDFWYDQEHAEWVMVLQGEAVLEFDGGKRVIIKTGDYLLIPKNTRHRVERTSEETVWLAIHVQG